MKIISKHWDFYDSMSTGDDTVPVYVRKPQSFCKSDENYKKFLEILSKYNKYLPNYNHYWIERQRGIEWAVVGIFPKVYLVPFFVWYENITWGFLLYDKRWHGIPLSFEEFWSEEKFREATGSASNGYGKAFQKKGSKKYRRGTGGDSWYPREITEDTDKWEFEDPEIFRSLECPIFIWAPEGELISFKKSSQNDSHGSYLCLNPVFSEQNLSFLKHLNLDPFDVYTRIENYLWSVRMQPASEPSNDVKILSAGFDLKTSFRNVK